MCNEFSLIFSERFCKIPIGVLFLCLGLSSLIYTPFELFFNWRLRMTPGTPAYEFWFNPPENILIKVYLFNVTNSEAFLNGTDDQVHLQEIGPIVFREKLAHSNTVFNSNSTLTYTATRLPIYLPDRNTVNLNDTIIVPNLAVLVMASSFHDSNFFMKAAVNSLINRYGRDPFVQTTIYNFLLNETDPVLTPAKLFAPSMVPSTNTGVLSQMYRVNSYNVTVFIGPKYSHRDFFNINNLDGSEYVPKYKRCGTKFHNSSETTLFPQFLTKDMEVTGWKSVLCRLVEAQYINTSYIYGMETLRFDVPSTIFNRTKPLHSDCYRGNPVLPDGLADVSPCYTDYPFAASFPHFLNADPVVFKRLKGLNPDVTKHGSFLHVQMESGIPLGGRAIFQINLVIPKLTGFNKKILRFSSMYLPFAFAGYEIEGLPWYLNSLLYFVIVILPKTQTLMSISFITLAVYLFYKFYSDIKSSFYDTTYKAVVIPTDDIYEIKSF